MVLINSMDIRLIQNHAIHTFFKSQSLVGGYSKVFLSGLPSDMTETDLRTYFNRFGKIMEVIIMYDQEKKKSRGFGFLSFEDKESVDRCVAEHYQLK